VNRTAQDHVICLVKAILSFHAHVKREEQMSHGMAHTPMLITAFSRITQQWPRPRKSLRSS
jgi:hypothetical protein